MPEPDLISAVASEWDAYQKSLPSQMPADVWDSHRSDFFNRAVMPHAVTNGANLDDLWKRFDEKTRKVNPRADAGIAHALDTAALSFASPVLSIAKELGSETAGRTKTVLEEMSQESGQEVVQGGGNPAISEFLGTAAGMAPYFAAPLGGVARLGLGRLGAAAAESVVGALTQGAYDAAKADPGQRVEAGIEGAFSPWNLLFPIGSLAHSLHKGTKLSVGEADAIAKTAESPNASVAEQTLADVHIARDPGIVEQMRAHVNAGKAAARMNGAPDSPPLVSSKSKLSFDAVLADGQPFRTTLKNDLNVDELTKRLSAHFEKGGRVTNIDGDPEVVNRFYNVLADTNNSKGLYDLPMAKGEDFSPNQPALMVRADSAVAEFPKPARVEDPLADLFENVEKPNPELLAEQAAREQDTLLSPTERNAARQGGLLNEVAANQPPGAMIPIGGSSTVKHVGYNAETGTMHVQFKQGDVYEVSGVKPEEHAEFLAAPSLGKFYSLKWGKQAGSGASKLKVADAALMDKLEMLPNGIVRNKLTGEVHGSFVEAAKAAGADIRFAEKGGAAIEGESYIKETDLYTRMMNPELPVAGAMEPQPGGAKPIVHLRTTDPKILEHEIRHTVISQLGLQDAARNIVNEHPLSAKMFNAFDPEARRLHGDAIAEEAHVVAGNAFRYGDEETIQKFVAADGDKPTVAAWVNDTTKALYEKISQQPDSLAQRTAQRLLRKTLRASGGLDDLGHSSGMFDSSVEFRGGQYEVKLPNGSVRFFPDRKGVVEFMDRFDEPMSAPELLDTSAVPAGMPRFALDAKPFSPNTPPIESTVPAWAIRQPKTIDLPEGFQQPQKSMASVSWLFRPTLPFLDQQASRVGIPEVFSIPYELKMQETAQRNFASTFEKRMEVEFRTLPSMKRGTDVFNYLRETELERPRAAAELHLTPKEIAIAERLESTVIRPFEAELKSRGIEGGFFDFVRSRETTKSAANKYMPRDDRAPEGAMSWITNAIAEGQLEPRDVNIISALPNFVEVGSRKMFLEKPLRELGMLANTMMVDQASGKSVYALGELQPILKRLAESYRGNPDGSFAVIQGFANSVSKGINAALRQANKLLPGSRQVPLLELDHFDQSALGKLLAYQYTYALAFRPGLVIRDTSQVFTTLYPVLGDYLKTGLRGAFGDGITKVAAGEKFERALKYGALLRDQDFRHGIEGAISGQVETGGKMWQMAQTSMRMSRHADNGVRLVGFLGFEAKVGDALSRYGAVGDWAGFAKHADLSFLGENLRAKFMAEARDLSSVAGESAKDLSSRVARELVDATQWNYTRAGSPGYTKYAIGRVFGQYGIWPLSYIEFARKLLTSGDMGERAARGARLVAAHGAIGAAGAAVGINTASWIGTQPMAYTGSPIFQLVTSLPKVADFSSNEGQRARNELSKSVYWYAIPGGLAADKTIHSMIAGDDTHDFAVRMIGLTPEKKGRE